MNLSEDVSELGAGPPGGGGDVVVPSVRQFLAVERQTAAGSADLGGGGGAGVAFTLRTFFVGGASSAVSVVWDLVRFVRDFPPPPLEDMAL